VTAVFLYGLLLFAVISMAIAVAIFGFKVRASEYSNWGAFGDASSESGPDGMDSRNHLDNDLDSTGNDPDSTGDGDAVEGDLEARAAELVSQMNLDEKASLSSGRTFWTSASMDRLDVPSIWFADGPHGLRRTLGPEEREESHPATCFPTAVGQAASWNRELTMQIGSAIGVEAQARDVQVLLGPGINIKRSPLGGRNFEYFSEDPFLSGKMATAHVRGSQSEGVGAVLKHYVANNQEHHRMSVSAEIGGRTLRQIYLRAFNIPVREANPLAVMLAYNRVNGTFMTEHAELLHVLREEWGYEGLTVSDWGAVQDRVRSAKAGLDLEMPTNSRNDQELAKAVRSGNLSEDILDRRVRKTVETALRGKKNSRSEISFDEEIKARHHDLARRAAAESFVLLKNEDGFLPLDPSAALQVALIGAFAKQPRYQGTGSSRVKPTRMSSVHDGLLDAFGEKQVTYAPGYPYGEGSGDVKVLREEAVKAACQADVALVFGGLPPGSEAEGTDRSKLQMPEEQNRLIEAVSEAQPSTAVVLSNGSAVAMPWHEEPKAILETWLAGQAGGEAKTDVLLGDASPSGRLPVTFPKRLADTPAHLNFPGEDREVRYGERFFVGYRYYDERDIEPLYPFGHGLSYTRFEMDSFSLNTDSIDVRSMQEESGLEAEIQVFNAGDRTGQAVLQLYVEGPEKRLRRPPKVLRGFRKVSLETGETRSIQFEIGKRDLAVWDDRRSRWVIESGEYRVQVGASSRDLPFEQKIEVEGVPKDQGPLLDRHSTVRQWLEDPQGRRAVQPLLRMMGDAEGRDRDDQSDMRDIIANFPLSKLALLSLGGTAEKMVERIVQQVRSNEKPPDTGLDDPKDT
jgi:beta-glucosidase